MKKRKQLALVALNQSEWGIPWWKDREFFLRELARRNWDIIWSEGPPSLWDRNTAAWRKKPRWGRFTEVIVAPGTVITVDIAGRAMPVWPGHSMWNEVVARSWAARIHRRMRQIGHNRWGALVCDPSLEYLLSFLRPNWHSFHVYDDWSKNPGWSGAESDAAAKVARSAALITSVSPTMLGVIPDDQKPRVRILAHACDLASFLPPAGGFVEPTELAPIPHPRLGYFGRLSRKNDLPLIERLVAATPGYQWIFVGNVGEGEHESFQENSAERRSWEHIRACPNVHQFSPQPRSELPHWLEHMDVNIMCYRLDQDGYWSGVFPLKLFEYLACGRPVVATALPSLLGYRDVIRLASDETGWLHELPAALNEVSSAATKARQSVAASNTWQHRGESLDTWLREIADEHG